MKSIISFILSVFCIFLIIQNVFSQNAEHILENNKSALVSIWNYDEAAYNYINDSYSFDTLSFWGCGFIVSAKGLVGTCYHVVSQMDSILIKTSDGLFFTSDVISADTVNDLALLKINSGDDMSFPCVKLGNSDDLKTGEQICVIGNPLGYEYSISQGIISGIRDSAKEYLDYKEFTFEKVIQTDAAISPGNSGGAFFNTKGEVIGITSYYYQSLGNLNFGVAINIFKKLIEQNTSGLILPPVKSNMDKTERIENYLEIANSLKGKIRGYGLMNDSRKKEGYPVPSSSPMDTANLKININQDSLDNIYIIKSEYFYNKCLKLDSAYIETYDDMIDFYIKIKNPLKAEELFRSAQEIFKDDSRLEYLSKTLETYYIKNKDFSKIKKLYGIVKGNNDVNAEAFYKLAFIYDNIGENKNALEQYHLAIKKDPKYYKAYFQIGKYYYNLGLYTSAKKYLETAYRNAIISLKSVKDNRNGFREDTYSEFDLCYYLGMISVREGDKFTALIHFIKLNPANSDESEKCVKLYKKITN